MDDTIIALSSAHGRSAIAVIRLSGRDSLSLLKGVFSGYEKIEAGKAVFGTLDVGNLKDDVVVTSFFEPKSYTGENVVEISCHGSPVITESIIRFFITKGARLAERGEFTRRAFENGKLTLTESEGIIDLIDSQCESGARVAYNLASGTLKSKIDELKKRLLNVTAAVNVEIDYPEEDVGASADEENLDEIRNIKNKVKALIETYNAGKKLSGGVNVVIAGAPNAGKSTLLNALVGFERAIVTEEAGTTRDTVEASYIYKGALFNVTDTAGVREGALSKAEQMGIERSLFAVRGADVAVVLDGFECECTNRIDVHSKCDVERKEKALNVSGVTGEGIDELKETIFKKSALISTDEVLITNLRQYSALGECLDALSRAETAMVSCEPPDILSVELFCALSALCEIDGARATEDVVNSIFARFCVGK